MKHILKTRLFVAVIFFIITVCALYVLFNLGSNVRLVWFIDNEPIVDLTDFDFDGSIAYTTAAEREFYRNKLLMPEEIDRHAPDDFIFPGQAEYATSRVRFIVPDGNYMIMGKSHEYASRVFINGELRATIGRIDEEKGNIYRTDTYEIAVHPVDGIIEVVFHNAAIIRDDAAPYPVYIGEYQTAQNALFASWIKSLIILGIVFSCALLFFGVYIFMPRLQANLWFACLSMTFALRLAVLDKIVIKLFPSIDYSIIFTAENGTLIIISTLYLVLIRALFGRSIPTLFIKIAITVNTLLMLALLLLPIRVTAEYLWVHPIVLGTITMFSLFCIFRHIRSFSEEQIISLAGQILFVYTGIASLFETFYIIIYPQQAIPRISIYDNVHLNTIGMLLFILVQMLTLFLYNNRVAQNERRLAAENALLEKSNLMKTELLGNISHEFKTPLTVISNVSQLASRHSSDAYIRNKMEIAVSEVGRMKVKVGQLLKFARLDGEGMQFEFQPVDISRVVVDTSETYFQSLDEHNNMLSVEMPDAFPAVKTDIEHLTEVIINLIENAVRFTRDGQITVRGECGRDFVTVSVEDNGSGMTPEQKEHIFERFYTGDKSTGTGLGLFICKKIIDAHGGEVSVRSEPGIGTTVSFTLPIYKENRL